MMYQGMWLRHQRILGRFCFSPLHLTWHFFLWWSIIRDLLKSWLHNFYGNYEFGQASQKIAGLITCRLVAFLDLIRVTKLWFQLCDNVHGQAGLPGPLGQSEPWGAPHAQLKKMGASPGICPWHWLTTSLSSVEPNHNDPLWPKNRQMILL